MKRVIGIFLTLSSLLTYLIVGRPYDPVENKITTTDMNSGVTTATVLYQYLLMYWVICVSLIITFILGIYFILAKEKQYEECPHYDTPEYTRNK
ncbi:hypothetical protein QNH16_09705 [Peribacillus frigoritolerans]|uniref:hypothetical protein n=1 Tax=Peribacillus frigoritolerans TaxID=450367 RepID=UPI0024BF7FD7|nr:hypothetical protein [Peribacillus frigoritolerans]WHY15881.1 hypothetical protein QNH16_09705 [Peribacillus frigoritolerans]